MYKTLYFFIGICETLDRENGEFFKQNVSLLLLGSNFMQQNTTRAHVYGLEISSILAFLWYFFIVYLGMNSSHTNFPLKNILF